MMVGEAVGLDGEWRLLLNLMGFGGSAWFWEGMG
jgi:hypothetical protein